MQLRGHTVFTHMHLSPQNQSSTMGVCVVSREVYLLHQNRSIKMPCCKMATSFPLSKQAEGAESSVGCETVILSLLAERQASSHLARQPLHEKANTRP